MRTITLAVPSTVHERGVLAHLYGLAVGLFALALVIADNRHYIVLLYLAFGFVATMFIVDVIVGNGRVSFPFLLRTYSAFALYALVSILWSRDPELAMTRGVTVAMTALALPALAHLLRYGLVLRYTLVFLAIAVCVLVGVLFGALPYPGDIWSEGGRFQGTFVLATNMARALLLVAMAAFLTCFLYPSTWIGRLALATVVLALLLTIATFSRAGLAAVGILVVGLLSTSVRLALRVIALSAMVIAVVVLLQRGDLIQDIGLGAMERTSSLIELDFGANTSAGVRKAIAAEGIAMFGENPIFGAGLSSLESVHGEYAHNAWADIAANLGLVGLTFWIAMYFLLARTVMACRDAQLRRAGYVAMLAIFLFELADTFYLSRTGMLAMLLLYVVMRQAAPRDVSAVP